MKEELPPENATRAAIEKVRIPNITLSHAKPTCHSTVNSANVSIVFSELTELDGIQKGRI